ncbi:polyprenyl synthetase family protein [Desertimonas flava]|uniref:polyprenyl synthetase family protein n=1 Tax=Desertimonas flava TaxID=2064846 RepID=UPI000E34B52D|nr:polyprenyl synthetase family protein [Desertimonas flava]
MTVPVESVGAVVAPTARALFDDRLRRYRDVTIAGLLSYVPRREPATHLYDLVPDYPTRPGKGLRPALCIATCRAFGGRVEQVLLSAIAIECFHNAFLVHDDVEDGSEHRRGRPTMHAAEGVPIAVNVGDALNVLSIRPLMDNLAAIGPRLTWLVFAEIEHMVRQSVEGQAIELGWVRDNVVDLEIEEYLRMTLKKTCWYTCMHPVRIGAIVATKGRIDPARFDRFAYFMGAAFQIQDDLLNLRGVEKVYGKEILGDLWEGKRTVMLLHLLKALRGADRDRLVTFLRLPRRERHGEDVEWVRDQMERHGSFDFAAAVAHGLATAARAEFDVAYAGATGTDDLEMLQTLVTYMIEREV